MAENQDVELLDVTFRTAFYPERYDVIGFTSGIYYGKFQKAVLASAKQYLPQGAKTFFVFTAGSSGKIATASIREAVAEKNAVILGEYSCKGFGTFGPFQLIGGIAKGHLTAWELQRTKDFFGRRLPAYEPTNKRTTGRLQANTFHRTGLT